MKRLALLTFTLITAAAGTAAADGKDELLAQLAAYDNHSLSFLNEDGLDGAGHFGDDPAGCTDAIDQLKALGVPPSETVFSSEKFKLAKAPDRCARYAKLKTLTGAFGAITQARRTATIIDNMKPGDTGTTLWSGKGVEHGKACVDAINVVEAKGAALDVLIKSTPPEMTGAQTRTWCEDLGKRAAALQGKSSDADAAKKKAARDRYAKHGAAGQRLELLVYYDPDGTGETWRIAGCKATDDPKTLAKSKILIRWGVNPDGTQVLRKYTFKGNKKVKDQEKSFLTEAKAHTFCK